MPTIKRKDRKSNPRAAPKKPTYQGPLKKDPVAPARPNNTPRDVRSVPTSRPATQLGSGPVPAGPAPVNPYHNNPPTRVAPIPHQWKPPAEAPAPQDVRSTPNLNNMIETYATRPDAQVRPELMSQGGLGYVNNQVAARQEELGLGSGPILDPNDPAAGGTGGTGNPFAPGSHVAVTPGATNAPHQMNVVEYGGNIVGSPSDFFTTDNPNTPGLNESMFASQRNDQMSTEGGLIDNQKNPYNITAGEGRAWAMSLGQTPQAANVPDGRGQYSAYSSVAEMNQHETEAAQGTVSDEAQVDLGVGQADMVQGEAAQQDFDAVDPRATVRGQLEDMESDWTDPVTGEPKIPLYAQGAARNVSKIAAFKGMTGTAAVGALSTAMQEASITMAAADAQFFQTLTIKNLDNRQETAISNANILANMEMQNADNRLAAAIQNSQQFLEMDLANLDNRQQANVIDSQARIQSILSSAAEENAARRFGAESERFYDELNAQIDMFNAGLTMDTKEFNSTMADSRQKFYSNMQFQIDQSNADWRRDVTLKEDEQSFEAARQDVQNMIAISNEMLSQIWDRSDAILDYAWKTSDNTAERDHQLVLQNLINQAAADQRAADRSAQNESALGSLVGGLFGDGIGGLVGSIFG